MSASRRLRKTIHYTAALLLLSMALGVDVLLGREVNWGAPRMALLGMAPVAAVLAYPRMGRFLESLMLMGCLTWTGGVLSILLLEAGFRFTGIGLKVDQEAWHTVPVFYRQPMKPCGKVFFRRTGPETWNGQVIFERVRQLGIKPNPYSKETPVTAAYDAQGFRNPVNLVDWDVALAGDSFTELGYLPDEALFTSVMARQAQLRVKNLGVSHTGPLTQLEYLKHFGHSESTRDWLIAFFEGNDLMDLDQEYAALRTFEETDVRPIREFDGSLIRRLDGAMRRILWRRKGTHGSPNAYFLGNRKREPITLLYSPPNESGLAPTTRKALTFFFSRYATAATKAKVKPWIVYLPCKRRILDGLLEFGPNCPPVIKDWKSSDLPSHINTLAKAHGVGFINVKDSLSEETLATGQSVFNSVYDTHFTMRGTEIVGNVIADEFPR